MKKILFFPQNETHVDNMLPLLKNLLDFEVYFLDASDVYHQNIFKNKQKIPNLIKLKISLKKPFPLLPFIEKIKFIHKFDDSIQNMNINDFDIFVYGNDGALQRVLINKLKDKKHYLILDGIISDYSFSFFDIIRYSNNKLFDIKDFIRRYLKKYLNKSFRNIPLNQYLPSDVGLSRLDNIFVISKYVKNILISQGANPKKITVSGMPRYDFLMNSSQHENKQKSTTRLMFITQGYLWHNELENDAIQHENLKKIINLLDNFEDLAYTLTIRIHPRDDIDRYTDYLKYKFVTLETKETDIYESIHYHDIILGSNSTVLLEAMYIGKEVYVLMLNNQYWRFKKSFISSDTFNKIFSIDEMKKILMRKKIITKTKDNERKKSILYYFNPNAKCSIEMITDKIKEDS